MNNSFKGLMPAGILPFYRQQRRELTKAGTGKTTHSILSAQSNPLLIFGKCLVDHSGRQFACIHDNCLGHSNCFRKEMPEGSLGFHALRFHPDDRSILCKEALPDMLTFFSEVPVQGFSEYKFTFNHRYIRKDGSASQFLQEGSITYSETEQLPVLNLKVFTEIGDIRVDDAIVLIISRYSGEIGFQKVFMKVYGDFAGSVLSLREREIIKLCLEGLSSKMIAEKLNLSIHTVKNHKRNCMEKTLTHNITELINLCYLNRWL